MLSANRRRPQRGFNSPPSRAASPHPMSAKDNPILNSPYEEPKRHYSTDAAGKLNYRDGGAGGQPVRGHALPTLALGLCRDAGGGGRPRPSGTRGHPRVAGGVRPS